MSTSQESHQRIRIGGIKLSTEVALFTYRRADTSNHRQNLLFEAIASKKINLALVTCSEQPNSRTTCFCADCEHQITIMQLAHEAGIRETELTSVRSVGILTLFPHGNNLEILGKVFKLFALHGFSVYGTCTSVSALSILTDLTLLEKAADILGEVFELPENHSPMRHQIHIQQISHKNPERS